jgi:surface antigen
MEWSVGEKGHVAFVEAVFPDASLQISEANWPDRGIYNERVMVREEWKKLSPTFITFA